MATEARQALQAKQQQIVDIEENVQQWVDSAELEAEGALIAKDLDLQRQAESILKLQGAISRMGNHMSDDSLKRNNERMLTERQVAESWKQQNQQMAQQSAQAETWKQQATKSEQEKQQLMQQNAQAAQVNQKMQQEVERWKQETFVSQKHQRENVDRCTALEAQLNAAQEKSSSAAGGDPQLKLVMDQQLDEIQQLMTELEGQRHFQMQAQSAQDQMRAELDRMKGKSRKMNSEGRGQGENADVPPSSDPFLKRI